MKKVIDTKHYSIKQAENMTYNLREKFNQYCSIGVNVCVNAHIATNKVEIHTQYSIYHEFKGHKYYESWQKLQKGYHNFIKEGE